MIPEKHLSREKDLAKRTYLYYLDKMADYISIGSDKYMAWYKDLCLLYYLCKWAHSIKYIGSKTFIGDKEINEDDLRLFSFDIREYITYDIKDILYTDLDDNNDDDDDDEPYTPPIVVVINGCCHEEWRSAILIVPVDDTPIMTLPFTLSKVDPDSIRITVNDNDPIHLVEPDEEGCHIVGYTLYWHTYYNLKAGDRVFVQYLYLGD